MHSISLSTLLVLSIRSNQAVLAQAANSSSTASSAAGGASSVAGLAAGLSPGCQAAAGSLLTSEFGSCSNIIGLVSVLGAPGSVVPPLNSWISGVCTASPCSNDTLKQANQTVSTGCNADIQKGSAIAAALQAIVSNYNGAKDLLCTQYVSNSTYCIPSILGNVQTASGQNITVAEVASILSGSTMASGQALANVPSGTYCTDCGHALVTQSAAFLSASSAVSPSNNTTAMSSISSTCGASFTDGKVPSSVRVAGTNAANNAKQNAAARQTGSLILALPIVLAASTLAIFA